MRSAPVRRLAILAVLVALLVGAGWTAVWVVKPNETGVVLAFGAVRGVAPPGMHLTLPWPLGSMERVDTNSVDRISVGFRTVDQQLGFPPPDDMVQWLTGDTNIVELQAIVLYTIADPVAFLFGAYDSGDVDGIRLAIEPQRVIVRRAAEAVLTRRIAAMPIDELLTDGKIALQLASVSEIQELLDAIECGIRASAVQIIAVNPPSSGSSVLEAFNDVQSARSDRERRIAEADGYVRDTIPRARGKANGILEEAQSYKVKALAQAGAAVDGFEKLLVEARKDRDVVVRRLWTDSVARVMSKVRTIVVQPATDGQPRKVFIETGSTGSSGG